MPDVVNILRNYFPARFFIRREPSVRRDLNHGARIPTLQPVGLQDFLALEIPPANDVARSDLTRAKSVDALLAPWHRQILARPFDWFGRCQRCSSPALDSAEAAHVLYVDGEMPLAELQSRLAAIRAGMGAEIPNDGFRILAADNTEAGINLSSEEGQQALEAHLDGVDLLILDNLSTLLASGSEGASDAWLPMQNWLLRLRRKGIAVLIIHHAGVNGRQRGTSRREDALDTVIALRRPADYSPKEGARFEVHLEKARALVGAGLCLRGGGGAVPSKSGESESGGWPGPEAANLPTGSRVCSPAGRPCGRSRKSSGYPTARRAA